MARNYAGAASTDRIVFTAANTGSTTRTYSFWINASSFDATDRRICDAPNSTNIRCSNVKQTTDFVWTTNGSWSTPTLSTGSWVHYLVTYDGSLTTNNPVIYYNGSSQTVTLITAPTGTLTTTASDLNLGNRAAGDRCFAGSICEAAFWNRILTSAEINNLANKKSPLFFTNGLIFYAPLKCISSPEPDVKGGLTGAVTGTTCISGPGILYPGGGSSLLLRVM